MKPEDVIRHELIGCEVEVVNSTDQARIGLSGEVVDESRQMLSIKVNAKVVLVPKKECTFKFIMPQGVFMIKGSLLAGRPHERLKTKVPHKWS